MRMACSGKPRAPRAAAPSAVDIVRFRRDVGAGVREVLCCRGGHYLRSVRVRGRPKHSLLSERRRRRQRQRRVTQDPAACQRVVGQPRTERSCPFQRMCMALQIFGALHDFWAALTPPTLHIIQ